MISGIPRSIRCSGARLHHEQEGFRHSPGVDYTLTVICAAQVLLIIRENFGQLISPLSGVYVAPRALNAISESSRAALRLASAPPQNQTNHKLQEDLFLLPAKRAERNI